MKRDSLAGLLDVDPKTLWRDAFVAYVMFGDASKHDTLIALASTRLDEACALADRMTLSGDTAALPYQSATVVAGAMRVLALGGAKTKPRVEGLRKKGPPAARALDAFEPLRERVVGRPKSPPASTRGRAPADVASAIVAYDELVRLGDVRAVPVLVALARDAKYVSWLAKLAETTPLRALVQLQPIGILGLAERALTDASVLDEPRWLPHLSDAHAVEATQRALDRWRASGTNAARRKVIAASLAE